jgi:hypothetical protein
MKAGQGWAAMAVAAAGLAAAIGAVLAGRREHPGGGGG